MVNKVVLVGRLGGDPELRTSQQGSQFVTFSVATNRSWQDGKGGWQDETEWHNITVFGKQCDGIMERYTKGALVFVDGRIQSRRVEKDGEAKTYYGIVAAGCRLLSPRKDNQNRSADWETQLNDALKDSGVASPSGGQEDIPF
jgi:single-strand DNA-binding protein